MFKPTIVTENLFLPSLSGFLFPSFSQSKLTRVQQRVTQQKIEKYPCSISSWNKDIKYYMKQPSAQSHLGYWLQIFEKELSIDWLFTHSNKFPLLSSFVQVFKNR